MHCFVAVSAAAAYRIKCASKKDKIKTKKTPECYITQSTVTFEHAEALAHCAVRLIASFVKQHQQNLPGSSPFLHAYTRNNKAFKFLLLIHKGRDELHICSLLPLYQTSA
jgi:hypothetical protein